MVLQECGKPKEVGKKKNVRGMCMNTRTSIGVWPKVIVEEEGRAEVTEGRYAPRRRRDKAEG